MLDKNSVQSIILKALENINDERELDEQIEVGLETRLFGPDATLDSLSLVSLIVDVEAAISAAIGKEISLTDDEAMNQQISPFTDVNTLTSYILLLISKTL